ncbi:hypothetical protein CapIbe_012435 [Capra ibex]
MDRREPGSALPLRDLPPSHSRSPFGFLTWRKNSSTACPQVLRKPQATDRGLSSAATRTQAREGPRGVTEPGLTPGC